MDTSNNQQTEEGDFTIAELLKSDHPEEVELGKRAQEVLKSVLDKMKPLMAYISCPLPFSEDVELTAMKCGNVVSFRVVCLGPIYQDQEKLIFFNENMLVFAGRKCKRDLQHYHIMRTFSRDFSDLDILFEGFLSALQSILKNAERKREIHLASIKKRSEMFDKILETLAE